MTKQLALEEFESVLHRAWNFQTSSKPKEYFDRNRAWGTMRDHGFACSRFLGRQLLRGEIPGIGSHHWNQFADSTPNRISRSASSPTIRRL
jgi:hypothetical protein